MEGKERKEREGGREEWKDGRKGFISRFTHHASLVTHHVAFSIILLSCCLHLSVAAPPNPYLFYDKDPLTGEWTPKPGRNTPQFLSALQGCCLAREQSVLQPDGIEYVLAIKIDFSDQPGNRPGETFDQYLFGAEGVSLKTYYREVSYEQMDVQPGPAGGVLPKGNNWVRAKRPMGYYGEGRYNIPLYQELVREACTAVDAIVDFSQYDRDKDGVVDHLYIIHAGDDEASTFTGVYGDNIWSILTNGVNGRFDGVRVDTALVVAEEPSFNKPHLGIYFHEFFHNFGAPDVYGAGITDAYDNKWDLMGAFGPYQGDLVGGVGDGLKPSHIMGYLKWDFDARPENGRLGWIQPVEIKENTSNLQIPCLELPPKQNKLFKIDIPGKVNSSGNSVEFFLIENRYRESGATFDTRLPESGILIWHIDETKVRPSYSVDAADQLWLEDPDDPEHENLFSITEGAAYSADDKQTSFTPATRPNSHANDGTVSGISITNIGFEGKIMLISVSFGDTYEPNDNFASAFPIELNQTYESFIFSPDDPRDVYRFDGIQGQAIVIILNIPETVDYQLSLFDTSGGKITDGERSGRTEQRIVYRPGRTGTLYISIESRFGSSNVDSYRLTVNAVQTKSGTLKVAQIRVFPNPVRAGNSEVTFAYTIADFQLAQVVELEIFNLDGNLVHQDSRREVIGSNRFRWNGKNEGGNAIASGVYLYVISVTRGHETVREIGKISVVK